MTTDERIRANGNKRQSELGRLVMEAEGRFLSLLDELDYGYYVVDFEGNITDCSEAACHILGRTREELIGMNNREFMSPVSARKAYQLFNEVFRTGTPKRAADGVIFRPDGAVRVVEATISIARSPEGEPAGFMGIIHDVTDTKAVERQLVEQETTLRAITDGARDAIIMMDESGRITFWNPGAERIFGYSAEECTGLDLHRLLSAEEYRSRYEEAFPRFQATGLGDAIGRTIRLVGLRKGGERFPLELSLSAAKLKGRLCSIGIVRDISEAVKAEEAIKAGEEKFRMLFDLSPTGIVRTTANGKVMEANQTARRILGLGDSEPIEDLSALDFYADPKERKTVTRELLRDGSLTNRPVTLKRRDGSEFTALLSAVMETAGKEEVEPSFYVTMVDFTEMGRMQEELEESENRYRLIFQRNLAGVYTMDLEGRLLDCNGAFADMFGFSSREEAVSSSFNESHSFTADAESHALFLEEIRDKGFLLEWDSLARRRNGEVFWVLENAVLIDEPGHEPYILGSALDTTRTKEAERHRQREKHLETVAALTGGLAHEIRNPLFAISLNSEILAKKGSSASDAVAIANIQEHVKRLGNLIGIVTDLGQSLSEEELKSVDLSICLRSAQDWFKEQNPGRAQELIVEEVSTNTRFLGNERALVRVLEQLLQNAQEASPSGGEIRVTLERKKGTVAIAVSDEGSGIAAKALPRLFEPFFTTKKNHSGLGLAICLHLVESQGGTLSAANKPDDKGSVFTVELPLFEGSD